MQMEIDKAFQVALSHQKSGNFSAAERIYREILAQAPQHADSLHFLGLVEHNKGNHQEAIRLIRRSLTLKPNESAFHQNLGGVLKECGYFGDAVEHFQRAIEADPQDFTALGNLCYAHDRLGNRDDAIRYGQLALEAKDRLACERSLPHDENPVELCVAEPLNVRDRTTNIIAFSLWGEDPYYLEGAVANAMIARHIYPEWMCRFYCDLSVPRSVIDQLVELGSQVRQFKTQPEGNYGLFWRFYVANDPEVERFLCRDCDCRLNVKERVAVEEWIDSGQRFHIMRDNVVHTELILAGMWGGISGVLPDIKKLSREYFQQYGQRWTDQHFLREKIWPLVKDRSLTHDSHYRLGNSRRFPRYGSMPTPAHVGGSVSRLTEVAGSRGAVGTSSSLQGHFGGQGAKHRKFIFTLTPGRSGTRYLANLLHDNLPDAEVHHERTGFDRFGVDTPEVSHFTLFNTKGNVSKVRQFWSQKLRRIADGEYRIYVETSHLLMKAGLVENIDVVRQSGEVHFIILKRDIKQILWSFKRRFDFINTGHMWLWYLDPNYPRRIVDSAPFRSSGPNGTTLWYICEIYARAEYYRRLLSARENVFFHDCKLSDIATAEGAGRLFSALGEPKPTDQIQVPPPQNETTNRVEFGEKETAVTNHLVDNLTFDPRAVAGEFVDRGFRL